MSKTFNEFEEVAKQYGQTNSGKDGWFRLSPGENKVRILSGYDVLASHFFGKGQKAVICVGKDAGCAYHKPADKRPTPKYLMWIIDRKDGLVKIGEFPYTVVKAVADLKVNAEYGFEHLPGYDLIITKKGEGLDTEYNVVPARKDSELTDEEKAAFMEKEDISDIVEKIKAKVAPPTLAKPEEPEIETIEYPDDEIDVKTAFD